MALRMKVQGRIISGLVFPSPTKQIVDDCRRIEGHSRGEGSWGVEGGSEAGSLQSDICQLTAKQSGKAKELRSGSKTNVVGKSRNSSNKVGEPKRSAGPR